MRSKGVVFITGGTGFLGRNVANFLKHEYTIILSGRNNKLNQKAREITGCNVVPMDVCNIDAVRENFKIYKPDIVIHAAATKYVDLSEIFPNECIDVNIRGSQNVARAAIDQDVSTVIGISTDKAAQPGKSIYGLSKATMERLFLRLNGQSGTRFLCTRFGNIAWSTGSVFPIWKSMLETEGVIKATGIGMRRFLFSVENASKIVIDALESADKLNGCILLKQMKSVEIKDLLSAFLGLYGGDYVQVAPRIGESADEAMVSNNELPFVDKINIGGADYLTLSLKKSDTFELPNQLDTSGVEKLSNSEIMDLIREPDYWFV